MALSLSVIAGLALLLPGLFAILFWNLRGRRHGGSRPDLPITAISVLAFGIAISLFAHALAWLVSHTVIDLLLAIGDHLPTSFPLWPALRNPIETMLVLARGGAPATTIEPYEIALAVAALFAECVVVVAFLADEGLDLALDGVDIGNQGWVYTHVLQPAQNGYRPVAFVLTNLQKDGLGVGYRGTIADIRQSDRGETLAITLGEPARFLYELQAAKTGMGYGKSDEAPAFVRHQEEDVGSVVALDARVIQNIVVANRRSSQLALLGQLEEQRLRGGVDNA